MSESSDGHVVYVNLYKLSWPIEGPVDGQIMRGYAAYSLGGQNYGPARWDGPSPQWNVYSQQIASCDCPPNNEDHSEWAQLMYDSIHQKHNIFSHNSLNS